MFGHLAGIIFDLDDTLVTSSLNFRQLKKSLKCPEDTDILTFINRLPNDQQKQAHETVVAHEMEDAHRSTWIDGAKHTVEQLHADQLPMAIVTRNCTLAATTKIRLNQIPIKRVVTREHAPAKPDPTALLMIAEEWGICPSQIAYVGDYHYDMTAANRAGMIACLYQPGEPADYRHEADFVFSHFHALDKAINDQRTVKLGML